MATSAPPSGPQTYVVAEALSPARRFVMLATPPAFAALTLLHPSDHPQHLEDAVNRWLVVHVVQLILCVLLAYCIWFLLDGLAGRAATLARATIPVFLVAFSAFDGVAGLGTGWLAHVAAGQSGAERAATQEAIATLFDDNWITGNLSVAGSVAGTAWVVIAIASALALRRAGADRLTWGLMAGSLLFIAHPPPAGTLGMLALTGAAFRWDRRQRAVRRAGRPST
jgi:hypothetical protein